MKASVAKMIGDYLREASVLLLVFGVIEPVEHTTRSVVLLGLAMVLFTAGAVLERARS